MNHRKVTDGLSVAPQVVAADFPAIKEAGFGSIISARPDGESGDQPDFSEIAAAAEAEGLPARHIPVVPGQAIEADIRAFAAAMRELPGPVLAYCRSGARAEALWQAAQRMGA